MGIFDLYRDVRDAQPSCGAEHCSRTARVERSSHAAIIGSRSWADTAVSDAGCLIRHDHGRNDDGVSVRRFAHGAQPQSSSDDERWHHLAIIAMRLRACDAPLQPLRHA